MFEEDVRNKKEDNARVRSVSDEKEDACVYICSCVYLRCPVIHVDSERIIRKTEGISEQAVKERQQREKQ